MCSKCEDITIYKHTGHKETHPLLDKNAQIMIHCELYHKEYNLCIKPDIIIHKDLFRKIFPDITTITYDELPNYIIFDILYTVIHLHIDKKTINHSQYMYYHKCKIYCAYQCIDKYQRLGFLVGKEYRENNISLYKKNTIGVFTFDDYMVSTMNDCIQWLDKLRTHYNNWIILPKPSCNELYPNMNYKDSIWNEEKKKVAEEIQEITLVWNISYHKRNLLLDKNIMKWSDPLLLRNIYPFEIKESHRHKIQSNLIEINKNKEIVIKPRRIKNQEFIKILNVPEKYMIVDIESIHQLHERDSYFHDLNQVFGSMICIIGSYIVDHQRTYFKDFTIKYLSEQEEYKIIKHWIQYIIHNFKQIHPIKVFHWGHAEKIYFRNLQKKYPKLVFPRFECIDLLIYFKKEPITIQGTFGYGLKEIVNALYKHKLIDDIWIDDMNGLDAMAVIMNISEEAEYKNIPLKRFMQIKKIIYYNYMDCKVVYDILQLLKNMI